MKKIMLADLIKDLGPGENPEDESSGGFEVDPEGGEFNGSIGNVQYEYDTTNDNYIVTIDFDRGGSAEYIMDIDTLSNWASEPTGDYYNSSIRGQI